MRNLAYSLLFLILVLPASLGSLGVPNTLDTHETLDIYDKLTQMNIYRRLGYSQEELYMFSMYIEVSARAYDINQYMMIALFDIESKLGTQKLRWTKGKATDFGWGQIHIQHLDKESPYDPVKLLNDDQYSIEAAFIFMADIKNRYGKREANYYTRYHSFTPKHRVKYGKWLEKSARLFGVHSFKKGFQEIKIEPPLCNLPNGGSF